MKEKVKEKDFRQITYGTEVSYCPYCGHHFSGSYFCPKCGCEGRDNPNYKKGKK